MTTFLLILHGLIGVALLGAITHQAVAILRSGAPREPSFISRYSSVNQRTFPVAVVCLYVVGVVLGAVIYPAYRLDVRIPFEEMRLARAVGLFELKEHFAGIGLGLLPVYLYAWKGAQSSDELRVDRKVLTLLLSFVVWWDFLIGHILNNIRGLA